MAQEMKCKLRLEADYRLKQSRQNSGQIYNALLFLLEAVS